MKKPFKVGQRVAVYNFGIRYVGTIFDVFKDGIDVAEDPDNKGMRVHPKQLRRLVKKERRRVWIPETSLPHDMIGKCEDAAWVSADDRSKDGWVEFIEVKKPKP